MYKTILFAVDLNEKSSWVKALPTALELARAFGAKLHVITVVPDFGMSIVGSFFPAGHEKKVLTETGTALRAFVDTNVPDGGAVVCDVGHGTVYEEILKAAGRIGADLIVLAAHRPAQKDYLLGPNAARITRHAQCSVMVVRG